MSDAQSDRLAIQDVIARYAACIDRRDFRTYRDCFHEDAEMHGFAPEPIRGPDAWIAFVERVLERYESTQHLIGPPLVDLHGDRAEARTPLQARHFHREPRGRVMTLWGTYTTSLERREGTWRIGRHALETAATEISEKARLPD